MEDRAPSLAPLRSPLLPSLRLSLALPLPLACVLWLAFLCGPLFFFGLGDRDLTSSHEARAAQDAQTILTTGEWGLPRLFDGKVELQKPPLYYWLVAALARLHGGPVDAWAVRLPAALAGLGTVLLVGLLGLGVGRPLAGLLGGTILATSLHFTWLARVGRIDMPLTLTAALALAGFYLGHERLRVANGRGAWRWFLASYLAVAVGLLLKGPIAAVLPGVVAAAYLVVERRRDRGDTARPSPLRAAHDFGVWWGIPLTLALAAPWFLWANARTGGELF